MTASAYMVPPLTTFEQPKYEVLRGTLIIRQSTAPPKV
jgi:hypothetical protein